MINYIDYRDKYKDALKIFQQRQWGENSDSDEIFDDINNYIIKLVLNDDVLIGTIIYHKINEKVVYLDMVVIDKQYQKMGIGSKLLGDLIIYAKDNNISIIETKAIEAKGHINSKKLLENYGFVQGETINGYWGKLYPDFNCLECGCCPCICNMHEYFKVII